MQGSLDDDREKFFSHITIESTRSRSQSH